MRNPLSRLALLAAPALSFMLTSACGSPATTTEPTPAGPPQMVDIAPRQITNGRENLLILLGNNMQRGAQVAIGPKLVGRDVAGKVTYVNQGYLTVSVAAGLEPGLYTVGFTNPDGKFDKLDRILEIRPGNPAATPTPGASPTATPSPTPSPTATPTPEPSPTRTATVVATAQATATPPPATATARPATATPPPPTIQPTRVATSAPTAPPATATRAPATPAATAPATAPATAAPAQPTTAPPAPTGSAGAAPTLPPRLVTPIPPPSP